MKATFRPESAGIESDVAHNGAAPLALVAVHPSGSAGGFTLSKFSLKTTLAMVTEAEALPEPLLLLMNEDVLVRISPQSAAVVLLTTWAIVIELAASVAGL